MVALMVVASGIIAGPALAGGNGNGGGGGGGHHDPTYTISLDQSGPHLGGDVTFTTYYGSVKYPRIQVTCYQSDVLVYGEAGTYDHAFLLGGGWSLWLELGGSASCTADLYYWGSLHGQEQFEWMASTSFDATG